MCLQHVQKTADVRRIFSRLRGPESTVDVLESAVFLESSILEVLSVNCST